MTLVSCQGPRYRARFRCFRADRVRCVTDEESSRLDRAIEGGAELLSQTFGAAVALIGPEAALAGPAVAWLSLSLLRRAGESVVNMVSRRGAERAGAALLVIGSDARERAEHGETPRTDGFSEPRDGHRPDSDELLEGVLMYAAASYEERKVEFLGHLFDGIAFDAGVTAEHAHYLLKLADRLTYRQLVALAALQDPENFDSLATASYQRDEGATGPTDALALELDDLAAQGVIGIRVEGSDEIARPGELWGSSGRASAQAFQDLKLLPTGLDLHRLMRLHAIPAEDRELFLHELATPRPPN